MRLAASAALLGALLCAATNVSAQIAVPELNARVTDLTGALTEAQRQALEQKLAAFEARKGSQIAVLLVPTTDGEDLADFGIRVAEAWQIGRQGIDDGAILIVARNDRRMRIEVGYGLEGVITDAAARRIIDDTIAPHFRVNDFAGGLDAAIEQMMRLIDGEPLPEPKPGWSGTPGLGELWPILIFAVVAPMVVLLRLFGRAGGSAATAGVAGAVVWFLTHVLGLAILAAVGAFVLALFTGMVGTPRAWSSHRRGSRRGGWGGGLGGGLGGGGFGGGFGGGGFGGGGGSFGGGGSSGGW